MINDKKGLETSQQGVLNFTYKSPIRKPNEADDISLQLYSSGYQDVTKIKKIAPLIIHLMCYLLLLLTASSQFLN